MVHMCSCGHPYKVCLMRCWLLLHGKGMHSLQCNIGSNSSRRRQRDATIVSDGGRQYQFEVIKHYVPVARFPCYTIQNGEAWQSKFGTQSWC